MEFRLTHLTMRILKTLLFGALSAFVTALVFFVLYLYGRPDLSYWHLVDLDQEYTEDHPAANFADYLELEQRLFRQLDDQVYARTPSEHRRMINRYHRGSLNGMPPILAFSSVVDATVSNRSEDDLEVVVRTRRSGSGELDEVALDMEWPRDLYSLSHVALPFTPDDPVYGGRKSSGTKSA